MQGKKHESSDITKIVEDLRTEMGGDAPTKEVIEKLHEITQAKDFNSETSQHFGGSTHGLIDLVLELLRETWQHINTEVK